MQAAAFRNLSTSVIRAPPRAGCTSLEAFVITSQLAFGWRSVAIVDRTFIHSKFRVFILRIVSVLRLHTNRWVVLTIHQHVVIRPTQSF